MKKSNIIDLNTFKPKRKNCFDNIESNNQLETEPVRQYIQTEYLSKYMNKIKYENNLILERNRLKIEQKMQQQKCKKSSVLFEFNKEQYSSSRYQSAVNYLRNQENHQISWFAFYYSTVLYIKYSGSIVYRSNTVTSYIGFFYNFLYQKKNRKILVGFKKCPNTQKIGPNPCIHKKKLTLPNF